MKRITERSDKLKTGYCRKDAYASRLSNIGSVHHNVNEERVGDKKILPEILNPRFKNRVHNATANPMGNLWSKSIVRHLNWAVVKA